MAAVAAAAAAALTATTFTVVETRAEPAVARLGDGLADPVMCTTLRESVNAAALPAVPASMQNVIPSVTGSFAERSNRCPRSVLCDDAGKIHSALSMSYMSDIDLEPCSPIRVSVGSAATRPEKYEKQPLHVPRLSWHARCIAALRPSCGGSPLGQMFTPSRCATPLVAGDCPELGRPGDYICAPKWPATTDLKHSV